MASKTPLEQLLACVNGAPLPSTDWEQVIRAANESFTTGTLAEALLGSPQNLPDDVRSFLAEVRERVSARNRKMASQAGEAVAALNGAGIQPILLKGIAGLFADGRRAATTRMLSDIDLIVPISSRAASVAALERIGYASGEILADRSMPIVLSRGQDVGSIDLHFIIRPDGRFGFDMLAEGARLVSVLGGKAWLPSPTMQAATLVLHDQLHDRDYWRGHIDLRHMFDLQALIAQGVDWERLERLFEQPAERAALETQLVTVKTLLSAEIPARLTSGLVPRLQYRRRIWQARWPILFTPFTLMTMALHRPPRRRTGAGAAIGTEGSARNGRWRRGRAARSIVRRFLARPNLGKI